MRYSMRGRDGRNPYGSRGGYVVSRRGRRGDRGMPDYNYEGDMRGRSDYNSYPPDMRGDYHYPTENMGREYYPVEAMGHFRGYYGMGDMRRRDYDYGYEDYGDYGETLSEEELERWCKRLKEQLDEREKQMFSKEMISQKARQIGKPMEGFGEKELEVATLMAYTDYKQSIGQNLDLAVKLAYDWLTDKDVAVRGAEKLAVYYDCIVEGQ